jgi:uncharacterized hydrophobic protein (TIGR00271 family)
MSKKLFDKLKSPKNSADKQANAADRPASIQKTDTAARGSSVKDKRTGRLIDIKNFVGRVIEPEERTLKNYMNPDFWREKRRLYRDIRQKEIQDQNVYKTLYDGASPTIEYYILTVLSCLIATAGLIQGSTAAIIGAMVVAPLMTPILAFSLGIIQGDILIIRTSVLSLIKGIVIALIISAGFAFAIPMEGYSSEIMARTSPTIFDIVVAFASGLVGAYGNANKRVSNTLVGIAIAVALMPPLCTIGIGIGTLNYAVASGATLLFVINLVSISLAGAIVYWVMRVHPASVDAGAVRKRAINQIVVSVIILAAISFPVVIYMKNGFLLSRATRTVGEVIHSELPGISILELKSANVGSGYLFTATISGDSEPSAEKAEAISAKAFEADKRISGVDLMFLKTSKIERKSAEPGDAPEKVK